MDFEAPDWRNLFSSNARRKRFRFCPVGYYLYHVAGRDGYAETRDDWHYQLYCAKFMLPLDAWNRRFFRAALREFYRPGGNPRKLPLPVLATGMMEREMLMLERGEHRRDPKLAAAILEVELGHLRLAEACGWARGELERMLALFAGSELPEYLSGVARFDFWPDEGPLRFELGRVGFLLAPDLVWRDGGRLGVLDCGAYATEQEKERTAELFRAYALSRRSLAPEVVRFGFYDPASGKLAGDAGSAEPFTAIFQALAGEAALWRDCLADQDAALPVGRWLHPRTEHCRQCRFFGLCRVEP
ncbi:hypothetical protein SDC9_67080 [bioreactor metagenome]|uniref:Uncharacterized protein n=1 Tax=bioreactor metagenome TaxID=1076179 RepID=A0A644XWT4_9ZZZZ